MITTKIEIASHLAEYCRGKWCDNEAGIVSFPPMTELYVMIYDLTIKRPANVHIDKGNLEIALPACRAISGQPIRKNPEVYNYLSDRAARMVEKRIRILMRAELHEYLDENKHRYGIDYIESVHAFRCKYQIESIQDDALLKDHQRWRECVRQRKKRSYVRKQVH